ncbi:hypothetical protein CHLRE_17g716613v5 [Chlamydomonas reinhardtii]|uniref:Secreted protein n=1 Tax=Chlamydomonas reinhardtii TaxID=3055 RepID=A0A2K3CPZ7_CHLRE|nr:uncharacterized protein CHLRE_17g716613v5 [Chlamydomonas reinhardtii]PNW70362.1 hypothetical protein CHLRE_17g716613v5 [Chlamydomonas reinhardtii]
MLLLLLLLLRAGLAAVRLHSIATVPTSGRSRLPARTYTCAAAAAGRAGRGDGAARRRIGRRSAGTCSLLHHATVQLQVQHDGRRHLRSEQRVQVQPAVPRTLLPSASCEESVAGPRPPPAARRRRAPGRARRPGRGFRAAAAAT